MLLKSYNSSNIKVLKGLEGVRKRPGMYIGNTDDGTGLHHMVFEVIDNSIDESLSGFCKNIIVVLYKDNSISICDDGRGIPTDIHKKEGISAAEVIMTILHSGGKFNNFSYQISGGLHGVGISVVNALSEKLELKIFRDNKVYYQVYCHGKSIDKLSIIGSSKKRGTYIRFWPDRSIFSNILKFKYFVILNRLRELSFLNPGLCLKIYDKRKNIKDILFSKGGIKSFLKYLCKSYQLIHDNIFYFNHKKKNFYIELACQWVDSYKENIYCFTNNIPQIDGGTHLSALKSSMTRTINNYIHQELKNNRFKFNVRGEDVRSGLFAIVSIKIPNPKFSSQTKNKLISFEVKSLIESLVSEYIYEFLLENPIDSKYVINKIINSYKIREIVKKTREISRKKNMLDISLISGKLSDCQEKNPKYSEIFLVEGDSAGGSAKQGRNRKNQAILPLKGKIINVEKSNLEKILSSQEIITLISALGCGIEDRNGGKLNLSKLRYNKIIIMTDADVDGAHIRTLLLTFFYRYMLDLVLNGNLYIAQPPLYRIKNKNKEFFVKDYSSLIKKKIFFSFQNICVFCNDKIILNNKKLNKLVYLYLNISSFLFKKRKNFSDYFLNKLMFFKKIDFLNINIWFDDFISFLNINLLDYKKITGLLYFSDIKNINLSGFKLFFEDNFKIKNIYISNLFFLKGLYNKLINLSKYLYFFNNKCKVYILLKDKKYYFENFYSLINFVFNISKRSIFIQRYKGLGEMNPIQLWNTTMNPKNRFILKILVKDVVKADNLFRMLMGDNVKYRKSFVKKKVINIVDIDI